ncbi:MAG: hypothetical protein ACD_22C00024G0001, partial [uncultured bacterium]
YPTEVFKMYPYYITKLTEQERASTGSTGNYTGLFTSEIIWQTGN